MSIRLLIVVTGALALAACGNKGNLSMPPAKPNQPQTQQPPQLPNANPYPTIDSH